MENAIKQETFTRNGETYIVSIYPDTDATNPLEDCDGIGSIYSLHNHSGTRDKAKEALDSHDDAVPLSVYSHSGEYWSVAGELPPMMKCPWDSVNIAGAWVPDKCLLEELKGLTGEARKTKREEYARQACDVYNQWLAGDVYGYVIKKKKHCDACGHDELEEYESCWNFYGMESVEEAARDNLPAEKKTA